MNNNDLFIEEIYSLMENNKIKQNKELLLILLKAKEYFQKGYNITFISEFLISKLDSYHYYNSDSTPVEIVEYLIKLKKSI